MLNAVIAELVLDSYQFLFIIKFVLQVNKPVFDYIKQAED